MRGSCAYLVVLMLAPLFPSCAPEGSLGDIRIEICSSVLPTATTVELIVGRPQGFGTALPPGATLEEVDGSSPEELVWQIPEPSAGWSESVFVHLNQLSGSEQVAARIDYGTGEVVSPFRAVVDGLRLQVCDVDQDAGLSDAAIADAGPLADADDGGDGDAGILQNDIRVTTTTVGESTYPTMVSAGNELAIAWVDSRDGNNEIYFARLASDGTPLGAQVRVTNNSNSSFAPDLVWTGSEYGLAWHDDRDGNNEIYFVRLDSLGEVQGTPTRVSSAIGESIFPSLAFDGTSYAVAWEDDRLGHLQIYVTRIDGTGTEIGDEDRVTQTDTAALAASLVWTGTKYGLAWHDQRHVGGTEIYFTTLDSLGVPTITDQRLSTEDGSSSIPSLVWDGLGFAIAWEDGRNGFSSVYFVQLSAGGVKSAPEIALTSGDFTARSVDLIWTGSEYAAAWTDSRSGLADIYFAELSSAGVYDGTSLALTDINGSAFDPSVAHINGQTTVIWQDNREGPYQLFMQVSAP